MTVFTMTCSRRLFAVLSWFVAASTTHAQAGLQHVFEAPEGSQLAGLAVAADGGVYATLSAGGPGNKGVLARYTPNGKVAVIHAFDGTDLGTTPIAAPSLASEGAVYGTTSQGGAFGYGTLFRLGPCGGLRIVHDFSPADGGHVVGPLLAAADGGFYAVTYGIYEGNPDAEIIGEPSLFERIPGKVLYLSSSGEARVLFEGLRMPTGGVIQGSDGNLYGTLPMIPGGSHEPTVAQGTLYRLKPDGSDFFAGMTINPLSFNPRGELLEGPDGYLYGVSDDIIYSEGPTVFRVSRDFGSPSGEYSELAFEGWSKAGLAFGSDGNLYGAGYSFFRVTSSGVLTSIHEFDGDAPQPSASLELHPDGGFYVPSQDHLLHLAQAGGMTMLHRFGYQDGAGLSQLWQARDGRIYGTTRSGGEHGSGTLFRFQPDGTLKTLFSWPGWTATPWQTKVRGPVLEGLDGRLYGVLSDLTYSLFTVSTTGVFETLHEFDPAQAPYRNFEVRTALVQGLDGALYGIASSSEQSVEGDYSSQDQLFRFRPDCGEFSIVAALEGISLSSLFRASDGTMYAISSSVGRNPRQALVRIELDGTVSTLHEFAADAQSHEPVSNLVEAADGGIYGFGRRRSTESPNIIYRWAAGEGYSRAFDLPSWTSYTPPRLSIAADGTLFGTDGTDLSPYGTTASFLIKPSGELVPLPELSLGTLLGTDGAAYRIEPISRDGYYGFRLAPITTP